jgi:hypothetical protein
MITALILEQDEDGLTADPVGELTERAEAACHAQNRHPRPHAGLDEAEAETPGEITRHPNHDAVIAEVLHRTQDGDSHGCPECVAILYQQAI